MYGPLTAFIGRALREPTVHFALAAALLFGVTTVANSVRRPVVEIDSRFVELRVRQLERVKGQPLSEAERQQAEAAYVDEQVLAVEARARGLADDERIRAILHQKMLHILAGDVPQPTDSELRAYFDHNRARYARRPAVTVEDVAANRKTVLTKVTEGELAWSVGDETAARVMEAAIGTWVGPHASADGDHWFRVVARAEAAEAPALETIRDQVRYDWMADAEDATLQQRVAAIRQRYDVRVGATGTPR